MNAASRSALTALLLLAATVSQTRAQYGQRRFVLGLYAGGGPKAALLQRPRARYGPWGEINIGVSAVIAGAVPGAMTARLHVLLSRDDIRFRTGQNQGYIIENLSILANPEVSIPLRNRYGDSKIDLIAGIGFDYRIDQSVSVHNIDGYFSNPYLDLINDSVRAARRKLVPFVTAGLALKVHRRASITLRIRQDVQNAFHGGNQITLHSATESRTVNLSCQATRLLLGCQILLGRMPEGY